MTTPNLKSADDVLLRLIARKLQLEVECPAIPELAELARRELAKVCRELARRKKHLTVVK